MHVVTNKKIVQTEMISDFLTELCDVEVYANSVCCDIDISQCQSHICQIGGFCTLILISFYGLSDGVRSSSQFWIKIPKMQNTSCAKW